MRRGEREPAGSAVAAGVSQGFREQPVLWGGGHPGGGWVLFLVPWEQDVF